MFGNNTVFFNFLKKIEQCLLMQYSHQDVVGGCKVIAMVFRMVARVFWVVAILTQVTNQLNA